METAMKIRRLVHVSGRSIRSVSRETGLSRNTVRKYLQDESPPRYQRKRGTIRRKLHDFEVLLSQWYEYDLKRPKRERRTAKKFYEQLLEVGYTGSYTTLCRFVKQLKSESSSLSQAFIPLKFDAGDALQFDWSHEVVVLGGIPQKIKVAHFRLAHSLQPFVIAYPRETQEMVLDAFVQALKFFGGVPRRAIIDNPKTMVLSIGKGKERDFHPRFMALMNHYVIEPVACTPAAGWEKGQIEKQVCDLRNQLFKPQLRFENLALLNTHLQARCECLSNRFHPEQKDQQIASVFEQERLALRPLGRSFDGYVEKAIQVSSTCLANYDSNRYSVPCSYAKQRISLRAYASRVVLVAEQTIIAIHQRSFQKNDHVFDPWHYVPLFKQKPGALRNGAPFAQWKLPSSMLEIKKHYLKRTGGDKDFVNLLLQIQIHGMETVTLACELAIEDQTIQLSAIINLINRLIEPCIETNIDAQHLPQLTVAPAANCQRYEQLRSSVRRP